MEYVRTCADMRGFLHHLFSVTHRSWGMVVICLGVTQYLKKFAHEYENSWHDFSSVDCVYLVVCLPCRLQLTLAQCPVHPCHQWWSILSLHDCHGICHLWPVLPLCLLQFMLAWRTAVHHKKNVPLSLFSSAGITACSFHVLNNKVEKLGPTICTILTEIFGFIRMLRCRCTKLPTVPILLSTFIVGYVKYLHILILVFSVTCVKMMAYFIKFLWYLPVFPWKWVEFLYVIVKGKRDIHLFTSHKCLASVAVYHLSHNAFWRLLFRKLVIGSL